MHENSIQFLLVLFDCKRNDDLTSSHTGNALIYFLTNPGLISRLHITEMIYNRLNQKLLDDLYSSPNTVRVIYNREE